MTASDDFSLGLVLTGLAEAETPLFFRTSGGEMLSQNPSLPSSKGINIIVTDGSSGRSRRGPFTHGVYCGRLLGEGGVQGDGGCSVRRRHIRGWCIYKVVLK